VSRIPKLSSKRPEYCGNLEEYRKQAVSLRSTEEYKKPDCEDLTCDLKTLCMQKYSDNWECDLVRFLEFLCYKSVARERIVKTSGN
jgi:hypothetical protein